MSTTPPLPVVPSGGNPNSLAARVSHLHAALQEATSDFRRLEIRDHARATAEAAKILEQPDIAVAATELIARAERAIAKANPPSKGGRGNKTVNPELTLSRQVLSDIRVTHSRIDDAFFEERVTEHHELGVPITRKTLRDGPCAPGMTLRSGRDEWWTPPHIIKAARHALGGEIHLDPASCAEANEAVQATRFFTKEIDGLSREWNGAVWMNPPFTAHVVGRFIGKLLSEPAVTSWCCLVNNGTETSWGQLLLRHAHVVSFPSSRIRFLGMDAASKEGTPLQGQMIGAHFRIAPAEGVTRFIEAFGPLGVVLPGGASTPQEMEELR